MSPEQTDLNFGLPENLAFDGETYEPEKDQKRLGKQLFLIRDIMSHGRWERLPELSRITGYPEQSISARIRDLRKPRFGAYKIERRRVSDSGTFEYRMVR
jgi:hypothetical protein